MRNEELPISATASVARVSAPDAQAFGPGDASVEQDLHVGGVILAGVHPWGNCALEKWVSRPLLPIASRPLIWHVVDWLKTGGIRDASVCGNSATTILRRSLGNGERFDLDLEYFEDRMPCGPAGCARDAVFDREGQAFIVVDGTIVPHIDLTALIRTHVRSQAALTVVAAPAQTDRHSLEALEPTGIYVFSPEILHGVPSTGYQDIKESLIPALHARGERMITYTVPENSAPRVTGAASYLAVNMWAIQWMIQESTPPEAYHRVGEAWVHNTAMFDESARLLGPVLIGPDTRIGPEAMIVGPTSIGEACEIEARCVVSRSAVWNHCAIRNSAVIDQSILPDGTEVGTELVVRSTVCSPSDRDRRSFLSRLGALLDRGHEPRDVATPASPETANKQAELRLFNAGGQPARHNGVSTGTPRQDARPLEARQS